jgi:nucleotide-binding universal stress UspA family protein
MGVLQQSRPVDRSGTDPGAQRQALRERGRFVVVGFDNSPASIAALRWAATESGAERLDVLEGLGLPDFAAGSAIERRGVARNAVAEHVLHVLDPVLDARPQVPGPRTAGRLASPNVHVGVVFRDPRDLLADSTGQADLLVLGQPAHLRPLSEVWHVLLRARCPVVLVPASWRPAGPKAEILVGLKPSTTATNALFWARRFAAGSQRPIRELRVVSPRARYAPIHGTVLVGDPRQILPTAAADAALLVIGAARSALQPSVLGPVVARLAVAAPCPVAIVPVGASERVTAREIR